MANIVLDDDLLNFSQARSTWRTQFYRNRTASLINTAQTNGAARLSLRVTLYSTTESERKQLEGVMLAAYYNFDTVTFTMPPELYKYTGTAASQPVQVSGAAIAGSNTVVFRVGTSGTVRPTSTNIPIGSLIQFGTDTTLYRVNSYDATKGEAIIFPKLRNAVKDSDVVNYTAPKFTGHILRDPQARYEPSNDQYVSYSLQLDEAL